MKKPSSALKVHMGDKPRRVLKTVPRRVKGENKLEVEEVLVSVAIVVVVGKKKENKGEKGEERSSKKEKKLKEAEREDERG